MWKIFIKKCKLVKYSFYEDEKMHCNNNFIHRTNIYIWVKFNLIIIIIYKNRGYRGDGRNKGIERYNEINDLWETVPLLLKHGVEA